MKNKIKLSKINNQSSHIFKKILAKYFQKLNKSNKFIPNKKYLDQIITDKKLIKYWVKFGVSICGFIILGYYKDIGNKKVCFIKDFYILENFRHNNVGYNVIKKLIKILNKKKINLIRVDILTNNSLANKFWKRFKLIKELTSYRIKLK